MANARDVSKRLLFLSIILSLFVGFNGQETEVLLSSLAYAVTAGLIYLFIQTKGLKEFTLIGDNITGDVIIGLLVGGGFIFLNSVNSAISLGAPQGLISLGFAGLFAVVVVIAPIVEEFFFRGTIQPWLYNNFGKSNMFSIIVQAGMFALYHFAVYGGFLGLTTSPGLFVGAAIFGLVAGLLVRNSKKIGDITTLERSIVAHALFNFWLLNLAQPFLTIG